MKTNDQVTRRTFLSGAASTSLGVTIVPASVLAKPAPSDRLNFGHIGLGGRGRRFLRPLVHLDQKVVPWENLGGAGDRYMRPALSTALCDVDSSRLDMSATMVGGRPRLFKDFRRLLELKDLDAVFIASPDHWHALMTIMACQAGKDVYVEKPAAKTVEEGRAMVTATERYGRVVQVGLAGAFPGSRLPRQEVHQQRTDRHRQRGEVLALRESARRLDTGRGVSAEA